MSAEGQTGGPARGLMVSMLAGLAWWATGLEPFTSPALWVTLASGLAAVAAGRWAGPPRSAPELAGPPRSSAGWAGPPRSAAGRPVVSSGGHVVWAILAAALAAWELAAFVQLPRAEHPTLSSLANLIFGSHAVRFIAFALWLTTGFGIARR